MELNKLRRGRRNRTQNGKEQLSQSAISMRLYCERYQLAPYSLMLDREVKKKFMSYCEDKYLSPSKVIELLIVEFMEKNK
jgi:hypothetical protein